MKRLGALAVAVLLLAGIAGETWGGAAVPLVVRARLDGAITPVAAEYLESVLATAGREGANAVVLEIDTPGGLLDSTREIVKALLATPVPVVVWVAPSGAGAASAGAFIVLAADVAAMAPGTNIGASTPVGGGGGDVEGAMGRKIESFTRSLARAIAERRGRNVEWAESAVRDAASATDGEALEKGVIDFVAADFNGLLAGSSGRTVTVGGNEVRLALEGARVLELPMTLRQRFLSFLVDPSVAWILLLAGLLGLYLELSHPGTWVPGIVGALCLTLALGALAMLPIDVTGVLLIVGGLVLLVAELFLPSFGIVGGAGVVAFVLGSLFLFERGPGSPAVDRGLIAGAAAAVAMAMLAVTFLVVRAQARRSPLGLEGMVGALGETQGALDKEGIVLVHGELWKARAARPLARGSRVRVVSVEGLTLHVTPAAEREET